MDTLIKFIKDFFKALFLTDKKPIPEEIAKTSPAAPEAPKFPLKKWDRVKFQKCVDKACAIFENVKETNGNNRSPQIDTFNRLASVDMGSPYCVSAAVYGLYPKIIELAMQMHGAELKYVGPKTASSQSFARAAAKWKTLLPRYGCAAIFRNIDDAGRGHFTTCLADNLLTDNQYFKTFEFNTSLGAEKPGEMERDGQGAAYKTRSTKGYKDKTFVGFYDVYAMFEVLEK